MPAGDIAVYPQNAKQGDIRAIRESIRKNGFYGTLIVQKSTGYILVGNHRYKAGMLEGMTEFPVTLLDIDDQHARRINLADNRTAELGDYDRDALALLLQQQHDEDTLVGTGWLESDLKRLHEELAPEDEEEPEDPRIGMTVEEMPDTMGVFAINEDVTFVDGFGFPYDIPPLLPDMCASLPDDLELWPGDDLTENLKTDGPYLYVHTCSCRSLDFTKCLYAFYVDDPKLEPVWNNLAKYAAKMMHAGFWGVVPINFSVWTDWPEAKNVWNVYRARYAARLWQEAGIPIIPDVNMGDESTWQWIFEGIPRGLPAISIQLQTFDPKNKKNVRLASEGIATAIHELEPESVLFYAGKAGRELIKSLQLPVRSIVLPTMMDVRRDKFKERDVGKVAESRITMEGDDETDDRIDS